MKGRVNQGAVISMEHYSERTFLHLVSISRYILFFFFMFLFVGAITGINWLGTIAIFLALISWIVPGILLISQTPWFAFAWLRGMNPIAFPSTPWNELSKGKKRSVYFTAVFLFIFAAVGLLFLIAKNLS